MSVRLSAGAGGFMPSFSNLARMKLSMGLETQLESVTAGIACLRMGWNDQWAMRSFVHTPGALLAREAEAGAPIFTQATRSSTCCGVNLRPRGGICKSGSE